MTARAVLLLGLLLSGVAWTARANPPPERLAVLRHGINITNWFRFPPNGDPTAMRAYLSDRAMRELHSAGFTFVRLPVQPEAMARPAVLAALADALARLQRNGLAVVVSIHPIDWHLETSQLDRARLRAAWRSLAPVLRKSDARLAFAELLNEPVFRGDVPGWARLQQELLLQVRQALPDNTIILTGNDWGSIDGLLATVPESDPNVVYSFHFYEPAELTALAAYRAGLDRQALAQLPFPVTDDAACPTAAHHTSDPPTADLIRFYCTQHWDAEKLAARIDTAADWAQRNHVPLVAGEFGASQRLNATARLAWLTAVRKACDRRAIGWALWGYDDSMGLGQRPPADPRRLDRGILQALGLFEPTPR